MMRDSLFGDLPWEKWSGPAGEPWVAFGRAHGCVKEQRLGDAIAQLQSILVRQGLESRHYLQAWHFLRELGVQPPPDQAKHVYGVVIEVSMPRGLDLLAAYEDGSARYWNFSGKGVVWDAPNHPLIDPAIRELLQIAAAVAQHIGPWQEQRPPAPQGDTVRLNILVPLGLHFGQGPMRLLSADPVGGNLLRAGGKLMNLLIGQTDRQER